MRHTPNLIEIIRTDVSSFESAVAHLCVALKPATINWNYIDSVKRVKLAYKGYHNLDQLTAALQSKEDSDGHRYNKEVTELAAPLAFGRQTQVFDLPPRAFSYGGDRRAAYRLPFFFVEDGTVKAYCLQPRKSGRLTLDQIGGYATLVKQYLLDTEFYGESVDIEFVDTGCDAGDRKRSVARYSLSEVEMWSESRLSDQLAVVSEALKFIEQTKAVDKQRRPLRDPELPLFGDI